jgi:hypothetical protein
VKERVGLGVFGSRHRQSAILGLLCATVLVLTGCGAIREMAEPAAAASATLPHSMKGYELYSWQSGKEWDFALITGTNRLKSYEEIVSPANVVTEADWVKLSVQGVENLRTVLGRLPQGETVTWNSSRWLEGVGAPKGAIQLPDPVLLGEIESYCRRLGIQLRIAD